MNYMEEPWYPAYWKAIRIGALIVVYNVSSMESFERTQRYVRNTLIENITHPSPDDARAEAVARREVEGTRAGAANRAGIRATKLREVKEEEEQRRASPRSLGKRLSQKWKSVPAQRFKYFPRLPVEIKIQILRACLVSSQPIVGFRPYSRGINMGVLRVCKLFHEEGTKIFWAENRFLSQKPIFIVADHTWVTPTSGPEVPADKGRALAEEVGGEFYEVSSKNAWQVGNLFENLVREFRARMRGYTGYRRAGDAAGQAEKQAAASRRRIRDRLQSAAATLLGRKTL
ncbi:uncharacterized protein BJX67DRAFT_354959 [Aspergillus lucknowensis]|uniref:Uncharacterized protein n=1 Tax=Aspergillus lucknowensis TaxID=176173 RepID=A0ABR4LPW3_9EURO